MKSSVPALLRRLIRALMWIAVIAGSVWTFGALWFDFPFPALREAAAICFAVLVVSIFVLLRSSTARLVTLGALVASAAGWWLTLQPSNDRDWQPDVALLPYAEIAGDSVTIRHIRDCRYRTETDYEVRHYDRTFDLTKIRTADLYMVYWGSPYMAHTMISFGFEGGAYVCFSIETRKEKGEGYSAVKGLYRQFELTYVVADERDVVRLRTNFRQGEDVYLFRLTAPAANVRELFMDYVRRINDLHEEPEWYSALTHNCTTAIRAQRAAADRIPWDWRLLVNGYGDELFYDQGLIDTSLPLVELKKRSLINPAARAADRDAGFSRRIRDGRPGIGGAGTAP
jgi:hypothetical protein